MAQKAILISDAGIDGSFAAAMALHDPELEVLGLVATAGNVSHEQATRNAHILIEQMDPPRWPRLGAALPISYAVNALNLHGAGGLGGVEFPCAQLHHPTPADKLIVELVRQYPHDVSVLVLGPATALARAIDRDPEVANLLKRIIFVGGTWQEPGDASAVAEFHFFCDPEAARQVLRCGAPVTLLPLDVTRKAVFSPGELMQLTMSLSPVCQFLRRIVAFGIGATANLFGVEGLHLLDVVAVPPLTLPGVVSTRSVYADVETHGDLTRGMSVFDTRWSCTAKPNIDIGVGLDMTAFRQYVQKTFESLDSKE